MSIKSKVFAAAATLTLVGGVGTVAAGRRARPLRRVVTTASTSSAASSAPTASRTSCWTCGARARRSASRSSCSGTSNSDPAEDFTTGFEGLTSEFNEAGLVSDAVALHYGCAGQFGAHSCTRGVDDPAFEVEYAPYGVDSGLCVGVARTAYRNEKVSLQPCGVTSKTVWIVDTNDSPATIRHDYVPLINGSDMNFSHPFVLTYPKNGFPTDKPRPQLFVQNLTGFSHGRGTPIGSVQDNQLWGADWGVLR